MEEIFGNPTVPLIAPALPSLGLVVGGAGKSWRTLLSGNCLSFSACFADRPRSGESLIFFLVYADIALPGAGFNG